MTKKPKRTTKPKPTTQLSIGATVGDAYSTLEGLGQEFRDICDSTPDSLQSTDLYDRRDTTASTIENLSEPDVPEWLSGIEFTWTQWPRSSTKSRSGQCAEATAMLQAVADKLDEMIEANTQSKEQNDEMRTLKDELEEIINEAEGCEWPGMFG
jgi:hypothetical protein